MDLFPAESCLFRMGLSFALFFVLCSCFGLSFALVFELSSTWYHRRLRIRTGGRGITDPGKRKKNLPAAVPSDLEGILQQIHESITLRRRRITFHLWHTIQDTLARTHHLLSL
jgi:hypothetical protein